MIHFINGNMFNSNYLYLVNPVNCVGTSGAGVAKEMAKRFPGNARSYRYRCMNKLLTPGEIFTSVESNVTIINAATKKHWTNPSRLEWVCECLKRINHYIGIEWLKCNLAMPILGCGNGGLDIKIVSKEIIDILKNSELYMDIHIYDLRRRFTHAMIQDAAEQSSRVGIRIKVKNEPVQSRL